jgi:hypothetical protein
MRGEYGTPARRSGGRATILVPNGRSAREIASRDRPCRLGAVYDLASGRVRFLD